MRVLQLADEVRYPRMSTAELRATFLLEDLFTPGQVQLAYVDLDRTVIGSAVPLASALALPCPSELRAATFTERRELGVFNIGGDGTVDVDGEAFSLGNRDALYVGKGEHRISFSSASADKPAEFYLLSYPAHAVYPTEWCGRPIGCRRRSVTVRRRIGAPLTSSFIWRARGAANW